MSRHSSARQEEFEKEALPHGQDVYEKIFYMVYNSETAEELTQDTMLAAFKNWHQYKKDTNVRAWLFRIAINVTINWHKRNQRIIVEEYHDEDLPPINELPEDLFHAYIANHIGDEVEKELKSLGDRCYSALILYGVFGYNYKEISKFLKIPIGTIKSHLHRSRAALRQRPQLIQYYLDSRPR